MVIEKSRINSVKKYFTNVEEDKEMYVCVPANDRNISLLKMQDCSVGSCVVPEPIGSVTRFNLVGKDYVHKEMDKELRAIEKDYHIVDWHGTDHYGTCLQNRMCYPKEYLFPPLVRIILDNKILRSDILTKKQTDLLKHTINLFLEIFGYCKIVDKDEKPIINRTKLKEVSWKILPPGKYPWERVEKVLDYYFEKSLRKNKEVLRENHKVFLNLCQIFWQSEKIVSMVMWYMDMLIEIYTYLSQINWEMQHMYSRESGKKPHNLLNMILYREICVIKE